MLAICGTASMGADGPGLDSRSYAPNQVGTILSFADTGAAISGVSMHRGYLIVPMGADHGGGLGAGCLTVFDVSDLSAPAEVFDSRDEPARYQTSSSPDYFGDFAEMHHLCTAGDLMLVSERHGSNGGFSILDLGPLYDESAATKPAIVSRYIYPGGSPPSNYDGYSFAPAWQGSRYVFAPTGSGGLYVVDTSDPENPVLLRHMPRSALSNMTLRSATVIGNLLVLNAAALESTFSALVMDVSDPSDPKQVSSFSGPLGYQGFVYGGSFYGLGKPLIRHDFSNPQNIVATTLASGSTLDLLDRQEYGFGKDEHLYIGHYPGGTKWLLAGNTASFVNRVDSGIVPADDHAFITPLGNVLAITTDHNNPRKLTFGVHDAVKDTRPPVPNFHSPSSNATNVSLTSRVGVCFTDFIDAGTADTNSLRVRVMGQQTSIPGSLSVKEGIVNFAPAANLAPDTTYEVFLAADGLRDYAGNAIPADSVVFRFSTGQVVSEYATTVETGTPAVTGSTVSLHLEVNNIGGQPLEHSWDFGDGSPTTAYAAAVDVSHTYVTPGNHVVTVRTRMTGQTYSTAASNVQVIHRPIPAEGPVRSSTIAFDAANGVVWTVNPDNDSVTGIRTSDNTRIHEAGVGDDPKALALASNNTLWIANKKSGSLSVLNRTIGAVVATYPLPAGSSPHGVVVHPSLPRAYVSLESPGQVVEIDTATGAILRAANVGAWPRALALDPLEGTLWVSHFISPEDAGKVTAIDLAGFTAESVVDLAPVLDPDTASGGMGLPNYLGSLAISPDYSHLYVPAKKDNIFRGTRRNGQDLTFEHAVRSMASSISLPDRTESVSRRLDFDNSDFVTSLVYSPQGNQVFFVSSGSSFIWVIDAYGGGSPFSIGTGGLAPDGLAISPDGSRLYVHNFMSRTVTVLATSTVCSGFCGTSPLKAIVPTVTTDALPADVLLGKQIFYNSEDPRLSSDSYMSCASCHLDGGHDGRVWDFSGMGEGFRNTIDLTGRGVGHGPIHWSANFDEVHDFEGQIRDLGGGSGLMSDADFNSSSVSRPLGQSKAGFSTELDALAAYVGSLTTVGRSPFREVDGSLSADAVLGREIFRQENCASCHGGTAFTDSVSLSRHDVGTFTLNSGGRLGGTLDGLDTPTLRGLWRTGPYLHDGSAPTIQAVLIGRDISGRHAHLFHRTGTEIGQLVAYLMQIDDLEATAPGAGSNPPPVMTSPPRQVSTIQQPVNLPIAGSDPGGGPVTFYASGLPDGLWMDGTTGIISGAPSTVAIYTVHVSARDAGGASVASTFEWEVMPYASVPPSDPAEAGEFRYVKFVSLSTHDNSLWSVVSEFNVLDGNLQAMNRAGWVVTADSEETANENGRATRAFDGLSTTFWHTRWSGGNPPPHPHQLVIDMLSTRAVGGFSIAPRQDAVGGRVKDWEFYGSNDGVTWTPVSTGTLASTYSTQEVETLIEEEETGGYRYVKFDALTPHEGYLWSVVSEFNVLNANGLPLNRTGWVVTADSEETVGENGRASRAFDGSSSTFWHTRWSGSNLPDYPHQLIIEMLSPQQVGGFSIAPRQDSASGRVKDWRLHGSNDGATWTLLGTGSLASTFGTQNRFIGGARGHISHETWSGISGGTVESLLDHPDYPHYPASVQLRSSFEAPANAGSSFGSRMRAYLIPPVTGTYHLWIASDDDSVLRLSPTFEESRAVQIASVPGATNAREWTKYVSQKSAALELVAGRLYYIEALHREGAGSDHLAVGWTGPGIANPTVIAGQHLMPVGVVSLPQPLETENASPVFVVAEGSLPGTPVGTVHAIDPASGEPLAYQITGGNVEGRFAINSASGAITVAGEIDYEAKPQYQLTVTARNDADEAISFPVTVTVSNLLETNEEAVRMSLTGTGGIFEGHGNPALIGFASDPDGDGIANAFEVFFGGNPDQNDAPRPIRFVPVEMEGEIHMAYEFEVTVSAAESLSFHCMGSSNLESWSPLAREPEVIAEAGGLRTYRIVDDEPLTEGGRRMMRIAIEPNE
ncbi:discoidin domain-containing protein [Luteolibacter arcticus]|uniref:Discoidin domain-containing protein n=1 Tax=Luteolibacter arcticus TaxID=1581411 RepID=A0ABT3GDT2_9BACT|nr:discoidin domain-containing protein [Luteolibacter arcticus]MCW1921779.1 discoidin domain-containing protein [Luteolibacter arcticus]